MSLKELVFTIPESHMFNLIDKLKCFYTNATSLNNKWDEFNAKIIELNYPHIICITETWFNLNSIYELTYYIEYQRMRNIDVVALLFILEMT